MSESNKEKLEKLDQLLRDIDKLIQEYNTLAITMDMSVISVDYDYMKNNEDDWCDSSWDSSSSDC